jgi:hypothetical protein
MDKWKWMLLICTVVLFLLPAAIEWRNSKHGDKRTKIYERITNCLLVLWIISSFGIALAMYKDFSRKGKSPEFTAYLNGILVEENSWITIPETNDVKPLEFKIVNTGDWPADNLRLIVIFPKVFNVISSGAWQQEFGSSLTNINTEGDGKCFVIKTDVSDVLAPTDFAIFPPLSVQTSNINNSVNFCSLRIFSKNATVLTVPFQIHFTNGVENQHGGF